MNYLTQEEWKDIPGFEGIYQVSSFGRLKSFKNLKTGNILSNTNKKGGYFSVVLRAKGRKNRYTRMHRLVAEAFLPKINSGEFLEINHKDGNKQNTHVCNLEWVTKSQNVRHSIKRTPSQLNGMLRYNREKGSGVIQLSLSGEHVETFESIKEASEMTGVCARNIHQVATMQEYSPGKCRRQAGGFKWILAMRTDFNMDMVHAHTVDSELI